MASSSSSGGFVTAPHVPPPGVTADNPADVLAHMELVTVTLAGDPRRPMEEAFGDFIVTTNWYATVGADYGVGTATHLAKVALSDTFATPPSGTDVETLIMKRIADGTLPSPYAPNHDVLYVVYLPDASSLDSPPVAGVHSWLVSPGGTPIATLAMVQNTPWEGKDITTSIASHEIMEAATDPYGDGYKGRPKEDPCDPPSRFLATTGEVGDLCEGSNVTEGGFTLQRIWSNSAATSGDPCIPAPAGELIANVSPAPSHTQSVPRGGSLTFKLTGWSSAPTAPWTINAVTEHLDWPTFEPAPILSQSTIDNGGEATLTLSVPASAMPTSIATVFVISTAPGVYGSWPVSIEAE